MLVRIFIQHKVYAGTTGSRPVSEGLVYGLEEMAVSEPLAIIVATKDRPQELARLLESISIQEVKPLQIIIVDGSPNPSQQFFNPFFDILNIDYVRKIPASLTAQRNAGIRILRDEITFVSFLDDDIVLEPRALKNMMKFWEGASDDVGGAAYNLTNEIYKNPTFFQKIFFANAEMPSRILRSGFQSKVSYIRETTSVQWLVGCATIWRRNIFNEFMFDEWFTGYARYEDVDFSYRVGKKYKLFIVADARVKHLNSLEDVTFSYSLGRMETINRIYFVKKNRELSISLCCWALLGLFLNNVVRGLLHTDRRYIERAKGNLAGFVYITPRLSIQTK